MPFVSKRSGGYKSSAPKRARVASTPLEKKTNTIVDFLENEEFVVPGPASCRQMLVTAAPRVLNIPKEARHENQHAVLRMLEEISDNEKGRWETRVTEATTAVESATSERTEKFSLKDTAEAAVKEQKDVVKAKLELQEKSIQVVEECKEEHAAALKLLEKAQKKKDSVVKTHEDDLSIQEVVKGLKEGIYENPKELKAHVAAVTTLISSLGVEEALMKTLPQVLRNKPEERGSFDAMALQQLDTHITNHLSSLSSQIDQADQIVREHTVAVTAWDAAAEVSEDKKSESDEALGSARAHQETLQEALVSARKVLKEHNAIVKNREGHVSTEQCGLRVVEEVREALEFLKEYVAPEPEPAEETKESEEVLLKSREAITTDFPEEMMVDA